MSQIDDIQKRLTDMFAAPLAEACVRRVVFWMDERHEFESDVDGLSLPNVGVIKLTGRNNFAAKRQLLLDDSTRNFLVYDPLTHDDPSGDWLLDIKLMSQEFHADKASMYIDELELPKTAEMRAAVRENLKFFENRDRRNALRKLRPTYDTPKQLILGIVAALAGASRYKAEDIVISVLVAGIDTEDNKPLAEMAKFGLADEFWGIIREFVGAKIDDHGKSLEALVKHLFVSTLVHAIGADPLGGLESWFDESRASRCASVVSEWLTRDDDAIFDLMRRTEHELSLTIRFDEMDIDTVMRAGVLPGAHESALRRIFAEAASHNVRPDMILRATDAARTSRWHSRFSGYYECARRIAEMSIFEAEHADGYHMSSPAEVFKFYMSSAYKMDAAYRKFYFEFGRISSDCFAKLDDELKNAANRYVEPTYKDRFLKEINSCWCSAAREELASVGWIDGMPRARDFYRKYPGADRSAHSYVIVSDALRYEVAAEICGRLAAENMGTVALDGVQSIFPSITKFGMAALLPGEKISINENCDVMVDGKPMTSSADRAKVLAATEPESAVIKFKDLKPMTQDEKRSATRGKKIVYIYHNTIDAVGDKAETEDKVFAACEDTVRELVDLVKMIVNQMNGTNVFITADHGFLYTYKPLDESDKLGSGMIEGEILEQGRRYVIASADADAPNMAAVCMDSIESDRPIKGFAPLETIRIKKQGGGDRYVHGGISLQEIVVPVISFKRVRRENKNYVEMESPGIDLLAPRTKKITNTFFSLKFLQKKPVGGSVQPCTYTICMKNEAGEQVTVDSKKLIADRTSESPNDRTFDINFDLKAGKYDKKDKFTLIISSEKDTEQKIDFIIDIVMGDDFGFDL